MQPAETNSENLVNAVKCLDDFQKAGLAIRIRQLENSLIGLVGGGASAFCSENKLGDVLNAAYTVKQVAGQINVVIHTAGIILSLPFIMQVDEKIESLSLGAGNTGKDFDLETNYQIAEFKFIDWRGGSETIRQNALFKAFYQLAECNKPKQKCLYVVDDKYPLKFFGGRRAIKSVFSRFPALLADMRQRYGDKFVTVQDYYSFRKSDVSVVALKQIVPALA